MKPLEGLSSASRAAEYIAEGMAQVAENRSSQAPRVYFAKLCGHEVSSPDSLRCEDCVKLRKRSLKVHPKDSGSSKRPFCKWKI